jgi:peptidoglycan hydrolase CwlO-like protein
MEAIEKTLQEKALDHFSNQMLNSAINGINEAVAEKDQTIKKLEQKIADLEKQIKVNYQEKIRELQQKLAICACQNEATERCQGCYGQFLTKTL